MRVKIFAAVCLAWIVAVTSTTNVSATPLLPSEGVNAEQAKDKSVVEPRQSVSIWNQAAAWVWSKQRQFHRALTRELRELGGKDTVGWGLV